MKKVMLEYMKGLLFAEHRSHLILDIGNINMYDNPIRH